VRTMRSMRSSYRTTTRVSRKAGDRSRRSAGPDCRHPVRGRPTAIRESCGPSSTSQPTAGAAPPAAERRDELRRRFRPRSPGLLAEPTASGRAQGDSSIPMFHGLALSCHASTRFGTRTAPPQAAEADDLRPATATPRPNLQPRQSHRRTAWSSQPGSHPQRSPKAA